MTQNQFDNLKSGNVIKIGSSGLYLILSVESRKKDICKVSSLDLYTGTGRIIKELFLVIHDDLIL